MSASQQASVKDLNDLSKQVFMAVGPSRIAAYAIAVSLQEAEANGVTPPMKARMGLSLSRLDQASDMLQTGVARRLADINDDMPSEIEDMRKTALRAVEAMRGAVDVSGDDGETFSLNVDLATFTEKFCAPLEAAVSPFLSAIETWAAKTEQERKSSEGAVLSSAVRDIQKISTAINLISINASIEAARAGEAGRTFAVIAAEIQTLSKRSQRLLKEITESVEPS